MKKSQWVLLAFGWVLLGHLFAINSAMPILRVLTKCALLPLLILYLLTAEPKNPLTPIKKMAVTALFFSWLGDVLLTRDGTLFFLLGMLAFMLTHILNGFLLIRLQPFRLRGATWIGIVIAFLAISTVFYWLHDYLGTFLIPIVIYMLLIAAVWVGCFNLRNQSAYQSTALYFFIPGMFLFVLSDSLLALNKFLFHFPARWDIWVMLTYALAQLLLTKGYERVSQQQKDTGYDK